MPLVHGLAECSDDEWPAFKRYVALSRCSAIALWIIFLESLLPHGVDLLVNHKAGSRECRSYLLC
ncbi:hypothetical protein, partial [Endozoicomonas sp. ONNA2]|uniref:hypothetical protein n=1 Tax=Endozoicomonas sp. ONNA2 TaxID=2828741 RepID=UPI002148AF83